MPEYQTGTGSSSEILPDGSEWPFIVEDAREKESAAGNVMIELHLRIMNGSAKGPLIYDNLVFTEKAFPRIDDFRKATGETVVPNQRVIFDAEDCLDRHGKLVVTIDNYKGRQRNKVDFYVTDGAPSTTPVKKNELGEPIDLPF